MAETIVNVGETVTGVTVQAGDDQRVYGTADNTTVNNYGFQEINGGTANGTILNQGGGQYVYGTANNTVAHLGGVQLLYSGTAKGTLLDQGSQSIYGGLSSDTVIQGGGYQAVHAGQADGTVVSHGYQDVFGESVVTNTAIGNDGFQNIELGTGQITITGDQIMAGGTLQVSNVPSGVTGTVQFEQSTNILTVQEGDQSVSVQLTGDYSNAHFQATQDGTVTRVTLCFCKGTAIRTPAGDVPVEQLRVGDEVTTKSGRRRPIRWLGSTTALVSEGNRPVIVRAGAFEDVSPYRDVRVTRSHSFLFNDVLIPIEQLVNGITILFDDEAKTMEFFHIELDRHDILLAEGAPAESFRDVGNRSGFSATSSPAGSEAGRVPTFAPLVYTGPIIERTRKRLVERARTIRPSIQDARSVPNCAWQRIS